MNFIKTTLKCIKRWTYLRGVGRLALLKKKKKMFIFEREIQGMSRGGAEREGDRECEAGSRL